MRSGYWILPCQTELTWLATKLDKFLLLQILDIKISIKWLTRKLKNKHGRKVSFHCVALCSEEFPNFHCDKVCRIVRNITHILQWRQAVETTLMEKVSNYSERIFAQSKVHHIFEIGKQVPRVMKMQARQVWSCNSYYK